MMISSRASQNTSVLQTIFRRISLSNGDLRVSNAVANTVNCPTKSSEQEKANIWATKPRYFLIINFVVPLITFVYVFDFTFA